MFLNDDKKTVDDMKQLFVGKEIEERALKNREIFFWTDVNDDSAKAVVQKLLYFDSLETKDITLYINSPGGSVTSGMAIYDAMNYIKSDVSTVCMGMAASMGAMLLTCGEKGKRYVWKSARVMIHQPLIGGQMQGPASDIQIHAEEMLRTKDNLNKILSAQSGKSLEEIERDTDRDNYMNAEEAVAYGLVDKVL